jgi:hypothetical protein
MALWSSFLSLVDEKINGQRNKVTWPTVQYEFWWTLHYVLQSTIPYQHAVPGTAGAEETGGCLSHPTSQPQPRASGVSLRGQAGLKPQSSCLSLLSAGRDQHTRLSNIMASEGKPTSTFPAEHLTLSPGD